MRRLVYVIGEPGVGKSTTTAAALGQGHARSWVGDQRLQLVDHYLTGAWWHHLGTHRTHFGGVSSLQSKDALDTPPCVAAQLKPRCRHTSQPRATPATDTALFSKNNWNVRRALVSGRPTR